MPRKRTTRHETLVARLSIRLHRCLAPLLVMGAECQAINLLL